MTKISSEEGKKFVDAWKKASLKMEELKRKELPQTDTVVGLQQLLPAFENIARTLPPLPTSGLIEQQKIFSRAHITK
jgi:hypothetical protein